MSSPVPTAPVSSDATPPAEPPPSPSSRLVRSAGLVGLATMASRVLGVARDMVFARYFGAGDQMDAFNVAFRIPNLVRDLFAEGAMSASFVPTFTRYLMHRGREEAWRLGSLVISALLVVTGAIVLLGIVFAEPLVRLFAAEYASVPGKLELTVLLTRVMFPFLTLVAVAVAAMGMLNALRHFFIPALAPAMFNVGAIVCALLFVPLAPRVGYPPVLALALGTLLGGLLQALLQWPSLRAEGFRFRFRLAPRDAGLREVLLLMLPGTLGLAAVQINQFVNTVLATGEGTGAVSWLNYAFRLMYLPIGLFGVSIATAAVPAISSFAAQADARGMRATISSSLRMMLMLNVPATVGLMVLAGPIVSVIFERGQFTRADTTATAAALLFYAPGLVGYSAVKIASPAFYALRDSRTPVLVSVLSIAVNVALNLTLVRVFGYRGLALGTALASLLNAALLLELLRRRLGGLDFGRVALALGKILAASALMAAAVATAQAWQESAWPASRFLPRAGQLGASIAVGLVVLSLAARLLHIDELAEAWARIRARLARGR